MYGNCILNSWVYKVNFWYLLVSINIELKNVVYIRKLSSNFKVGFFVDIVDSCFKCV